MKSKNLSENILRSVKSKGFKYIDLPSVIEANHIVQRSGENFRKFIFSFVDQNGSELCLRPDLTIASCLRYLENNLKGKEKIFYSGQAYRKSPLANLVNTFEVTPPGAAAIIINPTANGADKFNIKATPKATIGKITNCEKNPTKKSFGTLNILVKSFNDRPRPNPSIINAKQIGAIFVTISIIRYL